MKLDVFKTDGSTTGKQETLPASVFSVEPNDHAIWMAVTAEMTNSRQGTSATKNRSAVNGGGRKPWRQKGRGAARAGTSRSPLWVGGGRVFGPSPLNYRKKLTRKVSQLARKSALSYKAKDENIRLIEDFSFEQPKTKELNVILQKLKLESKKILILTGRADRAIWLSGRNLPSVHVKEAINFSTYDVLNSEVLLIQQSALKMIKEGLGK